MDVGRDGIHVTVLQYSYTVTVEHSLREPQSKEVVLQRLHEVRYRGGNQTNTGLALQYLSEHSFSASQGDREQAPNLVYMVTGSPASDKIQRMPETSSSCPSAGPPCGRAGAGGSAGPCDPHLHPGLREAPPEKLRIWCRGIVLSSKTAPHLPTRPAPGVGAGVGARTWGS